SQKAFFGSKSQSRQPEAESLRLRARRAELLRWCGETGTLAGTEHSLCARNWVTYLGKVSTTGMQFLSGCTEKPVIELWKKHTLAREDIYPANALLEIRPFQVWLHHLDLKGEATVHMDTFQVARIAYCTADHNVSPNIFAWVYREINDDLSYQMDCHAVECESKLEAKKLAHAMMEAFKKTFHSMKSDGRIHRNSSSEEVSHEFESDDG
ncbi:PREDICTED: PTB-containing, cubilin and LRP1-interacting protein, partial [Fulmarus glacialis]|uniref:PTB-containing, cubilin and LRP1-interacting protein n=1 Tax=Fulmarus glacialis TaxID=30455 RepID=UPI00051B2518